MNFINRISMLSRSIGAIIPNPSISMMYHKDHHYEVDPYELLKDRLRKNIAIMPSNQVLDDMLRRMLTEDQAYFLSRIPRGLMFKSEAEERFSDTMTKEEVHEMMNSLFYLGLLVENNDYFFHFPEFAVGWVEFFWMKDRSNVFPTEELAELTWTYVNKHYMNNPKFTEATKTMRTLIYEDILKVESEILDYESCKSVFESAENIVVGLCTCNNIENETNKGSGKYDNHPMKRCFGFDRKDEPFGSSFVKHGIAEYIELEDAMKIIDEVKGLGMVQNVDNSKSPTFMCNCPKDYCMIFKNIRTFGNTGILCTSRYISTIDHEKDCLLCLKCTEMCPTDALQFNREDKIVTLNDAMCVGCGVCERFCDSGAIELVEREEVDKSRIFVPDDTLDKGLIMSRDLQALHLLLFPDDEKKSDVVMQKVVGWVENSVFGKWVFSDWTLKKIRNVALKQITKKIENERNL